MSAAGAAATALDLRRDPLAEVRALDLRSPTRDLWADEAALWDRLVASWAGLDDAAWHLPGAAPSDAGGPDWSLAEHVGHVADWQELAIEYVGTARATGRWPADDDFDGGDFDRFNERRRAPWTTMPSGDIVARLADSRPKLLAAARAFPIAELRSDAAWGWIHMTLHGHYLDHVAVVGPWADALRLRQIEGDPFVDDPRTEDHAAFLRDDDVIHRQLEDLLDWVPAHRRDTVAVTPGWTLRDHVGHLADWAAEGVRAIAAFHADGVWLADPEEGIDPWNERHVAASRQAPLSETLARYRAERDAMRAAVQTLVVRDLRSPDGWSWAYDCLHGHVRKHLAMLGPWCAVERWSAG